MHPILYTASRTPEDGILIQSTMIADWGFFVAGGIALIVGIIFAKDVFRELQYARKQGTLGAGLWHERTRILRVVLPIFMVAVTAVYFGFKHHGYQRTLNKSGLTIMDGSKSKHFSWQSFSGHSGRINSDYFWLEFTSGGESERMILDQLIVKQELQDHAIALVQGQLNMLPLRTAY